MQWKPYLLPAKDMSTQEVKTFLAERKEGEYTLLDVRQPVEYEESHLPGGLLIPLPNLLERLSELDPEKPLIVYCRSGNRSRMAAQVLSGQGFNDVYNMNGGIQVWQGLRAVGPSDDGLDFVSGEETPAEILLVAYAMEDGLREFYEQMSSEDIDPLSSRLFDKLAVIEMRHKEMVFELYREYEPKAESPQKLEERVLPAVMEGGTTTKVLIEANRRRLETVIDVVSMAMAIETQGLDLYLRYAHRAESSDTRQVLHQLAEEEKAHLSLLGNLMEKF
jgi:rhodanese-related sulfurtransferase/rubrerythrin